MEKHLYILVTRRWSRKEITLHLRLRELEERCEDYGNREETTRKGEGVTIHSFVWLLKYTKKEVDDFFRGH